MKIKTDIIEQLQRDPAGPWASLSDHQREVLSAMRRRYVEADLPPSISIKVLKALRQYADPYSAGELESVLRHAESGTAVKVPSLRAFPNLFYSWVTENLIDGWVYKRRPCGVTEAWMVEGAEYIEPPRGSNDTPRVTVTFSADRAGTRADWHISVQGSHVRGKTVAMILGSHGISHETPELKEAYLRDEASYLLERDAIGRLYDSPQNGEKLVNDMRPCRMKTTNRENIEPPNWILEYKPEAISLSLQNEIYCFDLGRHTAGWVHITHLTTHVYDKEISQKLVLPDSHRDLIEALLEETGTDSDVISGKNAGTIILCKGPPGVGKTLTAEVFAEHMQRPLYRVHAGQLGTSSSEIERRLKEIAENALAWNAVVLLDECDTYVRVRGDDIDQNAIVASFLRVIEYYPGALFMTSNREDIDDAIESRCLAIVRYTTPDLECRRRLWALFARLHGADLKPEEIETLAVHYEIGGRDIKMLLSIASRYASRRQKRIDPELIRYTAAFRGL